MKDEAGVALDGAGRLGGGFPGTLRIMHSEAPDSDWDEGAILPLPDPPVNLRR